MNSMEWLYLAHRDGKQLPDKRSYKTSPGPFQTFAPAGLQKPNALTLFPKTKKGAMVRSCYETATL
jgi:hypothetical protein